MVPHMFQMCSLLYLDNYRWPVRTTPFHREEFQVLVGWHGMLKPIRVCVSFVGGDWPSAWQRRRRWTKRIRRDKPERTKVHLVAERGDEAELVAAVDFLLGGKFHPLLDDLLAEGAGEGAEVRDSPHREQHVAGDLHPLLRRLAGDHRPPCLLPPEAGDELPARGA
eukprot:676474-Prorocentrum_minimum.AAC.6